MLEEDFDAETLVKAFHDAGFKKIIVTAKHHDGFCIWNSAYTEYDVASTSYKGGQGDILAEISAACTKYDVDMGALSVTVGHPMMKAMAITMPRAIRPMQNRMSWHYNDYYVNQLNEILGDDKYGNNGHFTEIWMDGQQREEAAPMHRIMTSSAGMTPFRHRKVYKQVMTANA